MNRTKYCATNYTYRGLIVTARYLDLNNHKQYIYFAIHKELLTNKSSIHFHCIPAVTLNLL